MCPQLCIVAEKNADDKGKAPGPTGENEEGEFEKDRGM